MAPVVRCVWVLLGAAALLEPAPAPAGTVAIFENGFEACTLGAPSCPGFEMQTPAVQIGPQEEFTTCYYFHASNATTVAIRQLSSTAGAGLADLVLYSTFDLSGVPADRQPPGTLSATGCGPGQSNNTNANRLYSAQAPTQTLVMPGDDGTGQPVAIEVLAGQPMFLQMHFINVSDQPISSVVAITALGLSTGVAYTKTATYVTYNGNLSLPPMSTSTASNNCAVPPNTRFWWFSTQTHKLATNATLGNGATTLVSTSDWQMPAITTFGPPTFNTFGATDRLTYACTYFNSTNTTVYSGDSASDEVCMGITYFFPADRALFCYNNAGPF